MSDASKIACYSFLPWLRQGISNNIKAGIGDPGAQRARIQIDLDIQTNTDLADVASNVVELIGPGDILGINSEAIIRTEPKDWITDFEPNYFPFIEFYDEDFPWRYSPLLAGNAGAEKHRLQPWITLVILKEGEFDEFTAINGPLPYIATKGDPNAVLPRSSELWAWSHVHVNEELPEGDSGTPGNVSKLEQLLDKDPDRGYSRIMCPRKLEPETAYHAFLVPTFETGRLAGLGESNPAVGLLDPAWSPNSDARFPYYFRWYFRTATQGDFEYLVRLLKPRPVDKRVGIRDMDVQTPGGVEGITDPPVMGLEGALKSPATESTDWPTPYPDPFQEALADRINLADDYQQANPDSDPIVTPPLYGRWHALIKRLNIEADASDPDNPYNSTNKWIHELNLDPRHRTPAGFGTRVVQKGQEELMKQAWDQIGEVLEANRRIRLTQLAKEASAKVYDKHLKPLKPAQSLSFTAPLHARLIDNGKTIYMQVTNSSLPSVTINPAFRKIVRPRGPVYVRVRPETNRRVDNLIDLINEGSITATPPKTAPTGNISLDETSDNASSTRLPGWLEELLAKKWFRWLPLIVLGVLLLIILLFNIFGSSALEGNAVIGVLILIFAALAWLFNKWTKGIDAEGAAKESELTPEAIDDLPSSPDFRVTGPGESATFKRGSSDSVEAIRFKRAVKDLYEVFTARPAPKPPRPTLNIAQTVGTVIGKIDPLITIPARMLTAVRFPAIIRARLIERFEPVMAYPEFPQPMYEPLRDISSELLIPNIHLVPPNTISLLITNQKFIESYMVGLNHEMGRELLWREYPTDQRGSYFRQFWDVKDYVNTDDTLTEEELVEKLKDIPEIHRWPRASDLGTHNQRDAEGDTTQLVLLIRGDLLKKYPNAVIYAHRAEWVRKEDNSIDVKEPRVLAPIDTDALEIANEKHPLYKAKISPDINFFGFDLTVEEAQGGTGANPNDDPGWYFVIKERPGEPRFGLDIDQKNGGLDSWDDISWEDVNVLSDGNNHIRLNNTVSLNAAPPDEDNNPESVEWSPNTNAADLAHITYQDPVLIAVHASEMLPA